VRPEHLLRHVLGPPLLLIGEVCDLNPQLKRIATAVSEIQRVIAALLRR
jgi:hypothetical protein